MHIYFRVISVNYEIQEKCRPLPLNSVGLIKAASSDLGMSPQYSLLLADKLYSQGYISYPRTDSSEYSNIDDAL